MADTDIQEQLSIVKNIVIAEDKDSSKQCIELKDITGLDLPRELCNTLQKFNEINAFSSTIFLGYNVVPYDLLIKSYLNKASDAGIFQQLGADENLELLPDYQFYFIDNVQGFIDEPLDVKNLKTMIPMFEFNGEYMFYNVDRNSLNSGLVSVLDGQATVVAPSIYEHIEDLLEGLKNKSYRYEDEILIYPSSWHYRNKLRMGHVAMDEYGEIKDMNNVPDNIDDPEYPHFLKKWLKQWQDDN